MDPGSAPQLSRGAGGGSPRLDLFRIAETLLIGAVGGIIFNAVRFPAGWLAGAMVFCAGAALLGRPLALPRSVARTFSVVVGMALGSLITPAAIRGVGTWPASIALVALAMVCVTIATVTYLRRVHRWDAMTALFAAYPGALAQVMAHAAEEKCDLRAVAVVQMIRVVMLAVGIPAALAAFGLTKSIGPPALKTVSLTAAPGEFAVLITGSVVVGLGLLRLGMPGGLLLGPMIVSAILHSSGLVSVALPGWVTIAGLIGVGSVGGSRFAGTPLRLVLSHLRVALGCFAISLCIAATFATLASVIVSRPAADIVIAYLPGAIDAMMALALALHLDPIFVGAHHLARLFGLSFALSFVVRSVRTRHGRESWRGERSATKGGGPMRH